MGVDTHILNFLVLGEAATMAAGIADFVESKATMLATLYARAQDFHSSNSILNDRYAADIVTRLDLDGSRTGVRQGDTIGIAMRGRYLDGCVREFLAANPNAIVLNLGCGLDSRMYRLNVTAPVHWYDVDLPDVVAFRRAQLPTQAHQTLIPGSVEDMSWLTQVPRDRPVLVIAEGLTMYLPPDAVATMLRDIAQWCVRGEMVFDAFSRWAVRRQHTSAIVKNANATLRWAIDHESELTRQVPSLSCMSVVSSFVPPTGVDLPRKTRVLLRVIRAIPRVRHMVRIYRYQFGKR